MMASPIPGIIEALGATLDGWHPEDGKDLTAFFDGLPELIEKVQETVRDTLRSFAEDNVIPVSEDLAYEAADSLDSALGNAHAVALEIAQSYREEYEFWFTLDVD